MKHATYEPSCDICKLNAGEDESASEILWQDDNWIVRHRFHPFGITGWLTMYAKRHFSGTENFTDEEAQAFGVTLRMLAQPLQEVTGALRIYVELMGETGPHFHCHLVPRHHQLPNGVKPGSEVFELGRARSGNPALDPSEAIAFSVIYKEALAARS